MNSERHQEDGAELLTQPEVRGQRCQAEAGGDTGDRTQPAAPAGRAGSGAAGGWLLGGLLAGLRRRPGGIALDEVALLAEAAATADATSIRIRRDQHSAEKRNHQRDQNSFHWDRLQGFTHTWERAVWMQEQAARLTTARAVGY